MPIPFWKPKPAPPGALQAARQPLYTANLLSQLFMQWLNPLLKVGYSRPLQSEDLWNIPESLECSKFADQIEAHLNSRLPPSRRLEQYKPIPNGVGTKGASSEKPPLNTQPTQDRAEYEEHLYDGDDGQLAEIRATEMAEDLMLNPVSSRDGRRGSAATVVSVTPEVPKSRSQVPVEDKAIKTDEELIKMFGKRKAKKIAVGAYAVEDGVLYDLSLFQAMFSTVKTKWLKALFLNAMTYGLQLGAPLIARQLIQQISAANAFHNAERDGSSTADLTRPRQLYHVCGLAVALFAMLFLAALFHVHWQAIAFRYGILLRSSTVDLISRKSMRLSGKARLTQTNGRLNSMITVDTAYLSGMAPASTNLLVQPVIVIIGAGLLIWLLGPSALVGLGLMIGAAGPIAKMFHRLLKNRQAQTKIIDERVRLMSEIINNIRAVKLYAYDSYMGRKVTAVREKEIQVLRAYGTLRSTLNALFEFIPVLAVVLTIITYSLTGHELTPATIFPALQFFNVISGAVNSLPPQLSNMIDARVAVARLNAMLEAEELESYLHLDPQMKWGARVRGDFQYDANIAEPTGEDKLDDGKKTESKSSQDATSASQDGEVATAESEKASVSAPFALRGVDLSIPRGALVCVVGRVGSGKSALFMGMINEMRRIYGEVSFGGKVSLVPQHAWVQSGSVRDNITFSTAPELVDDVKVKRVIEATGLQADLDMWQDGDMTLIGERGITLSGGQRQRICIARAAYDESEVVLLDDPLSAVDAKVGHHLLHHCILDGPFAHRTRILVTHHLDVLPQADMILVMERDDDNEGRIIQQGTYDELLAQEGVFQTLIQEYGSAAIGNATSIEGEKGATGKEKDSETKKGESEVAVPDEDKQKGGKLLLDEERETGEISWMTYLHFLRAIGAWWMVVASFLVLAWLEGSRVATILVLGFWSRNQFTMSQGAYMGIYAGVAASMAVAMWWSLYIMIVAGNRASFKMFNDAWSRVMRSPTSWHDRTPTGRILSRMSKDVQQMDNWLSQNWNGYLQCLASVFGTFFLVTYSFPWLGLMFIPIVGFFFLTAVYYTRTNRETKRVESLLRSVMYIARCRNNSVVYRLYVLLVNKSVSPTTCRRLSITSTELTSYWYIRLSSPMYTHLQQDSLGAWLAARLECSSAVMVLGVGLYGALSRDTVNPAQFGVALSFVMASLSIFSDLVPLWVLCQQRMNSVERVQHYRELETEAANNLPDDPKPDEAWPTAGAVSFNNVQLRYRPDLPLVLKGLTFNVKPGEKIGIIGRTGAGKSSIAQALFRTVEMCEGKIEVDGRDLRKLGLEAVRSRLAIIPQDAFLFGGTVRENIDPTGARTDAELNDAMGLVHRSSSSSAALREKFSLEGIVANEGSNFSAGERQLLSLMRALARRCKVLLLDEATSSVDPETDALIQKIIQTEFADVTLISIAHRLQTVAFYDRILVMDAGRIAEFDTPLTLFDRPDSIFRSLCQKKALGREDLVRIQVEAENAAVRSAYPSPMPSRPPSLKE